MKRNEDGPSFSGSCAFAIVFGLYGLSQLVIGNVGIHHHWGGIWAFLLTCLSFSTGFFLPLSIGAFFGARDVLGWHWVWAFAFAFPGLAFMVSTWFVEAPVSLWGWLKNRKQTLPSQSASPLQSSPAPRLARTPIALDPKKADEEMGHEPDKIEPDGTRVYTSPMSDGRISCTIYRPDGSTESYKAMQMTPGDSKIAAMFNPFQQSSEPAILFWDGRQADIEAAKSVEKFYLRIEYLDEFDTRIGKNRYARETIESAALRAIEARPERTVSFFITTNEGDKLAYVYQDGDGDWEVLASSDQAMEDEDQIR